MDTLRLDAVAARVVAWHNRHPLARRITAAQVQSVGYVALPFAASGEAAATAATPGAPSAADTGSLRERAMARARQEAAAAAAAAAEADAPAAPLPSSMALAAAPAASSHASAPQAVFSEDFIAPLTPRQVARWAARHGCRLDQPPTGAPLRQVLAAAAPAGTVPVMLYVLTAAVAAGGGSSRVLLGAGEQAPVLGRRLWSLPRVAALAAAPLLALLALVLLALLSGGLLPGQRHAPPLLAGAPPAAGAAVAAAAAGSAAAALSAVAEAGVGHGPDHGAPPHAAAASAGATGTPAVSVADGLTADAAHQVEGPDPHAVQAPHQLPTAPAPTPALAAAPDAPAASAPQTAARAAARPGQGAEPAAAPRAGDPQRSAARRGRPTDADPALPAGAAAAAPGVATASASATTAARFAISTRPLRTRAEAEQVMAAMGALLRSPGSGRLQTDIVAQGADWRVVGWPFLRRVDADLAREMLVARGMRVEVVGF